MFYAYRLSVNKSLLTFDLVSSKQFRLWASETCEIKVKKMHGLRLTSGIILLLCTSLLIRSLYAISGQNHNPAQPVLWQYKLDPTWPVDRSVFTGQVYCVAVDDENQEIYVGQVKC